MRSSHQSVRTTLVVLCVLVGVVLAGAVTVGPALASSGNSDDPASGSSATDLTSTTAEVSVLDHPDTVPADGQFELTVETIASAGTVVEFEFDTDVALSSSEAVSIEDDRVEFLDITASNSTYTITVDVLGGDDGDMGTISAWVNAESEADAATVETSTVTLDAEAIDRVALEPTETTTIGVGEEVQFTATAYTAFDDPIESNTTAFSWENATADGLFSQTSPGTYEVTATFDGTQSAPTTVIVEDSADDDDDNGGAGGGGSGGGSGAGGGSGGDTGGSDGGSDPEAGDDSEELPGIDDFADSETANVSVDTTSLSVSPSTVETGQDVQITIPLENTGAEFSQETVSVRAAGEVLVSDQVRLSAVSVRDVVLTHRFTEPGEYELSVDVTSVSDTPTSIGSVTVEEASDATESETVGDQIDTDTVSADDQSDSEPAFEDEVPGFGVGITLVSLLVSLIVLARRS